MKPFNQKFIFYYSYIHYQLATILLCLLALPYATPVDIWACGCIFAELFTRRAFIMGQTEIDQLTRIFSIIGTPGSNEWPNETHIMRSNFSTMQRKDLSELIPNIPTVAKDLIQVSY